MKPDRDTGIQVESTIQGQEIAMSFDESAMVHLMSVLTDLYSDPELAVIREYSTNAHDSHIEAGQQRPIEITLPTPLAPFLRIRDWGVGLSAQDIADIYSKYGASTKRDTDEQVGMLGLGCKSALTYASQFTLIGTKAGRTVQVSISRDERGAGSMTVVDDSETDEPNGVEVVIPAKRDNSFAYKAGQFFRFWQAGSVLVNGEPPEAIEGLRIADDIMVVEGEHANYVVMGNVPYPANLTTQLQHGNGVVAWVDIGAVHFTPNREALSYTPKTEATVKAIGERFERLAVDAVQTAIDKAPSHREALRVKFEWQGVLHRYAQTADFHYKGDKLPTTWNPGNEHDYNVRTNSRLHSYHGKGATSEHAQINADSWPGTVFVSGFEPQRFTHQHRSKLDKWATDAGILTDADSNAIRRYALANVDSDPHPDLKWIDPRFVIDWATVRQIKLPRTNADGSGRVAGSYDCYVDGDSHYNLDSDDIDTSKPLLYVHGNMHTAAYWKKHAGPLLPKGYTLVALPQNRIDKFIRDFPQAMQVEAKVRKLYDAWIKKLSATDREALAIQGGRYDHHGDALKKLDPAKVDDPALKRTIQLARKDLTKLREQRNVFENVLSKSIDNSGWKNPLNEYPLFQGRWGKVSDHEYWYLNAAYAARQKGA